jgi:hypothetical protein
LCRQRSRGRKKPANGSNFGTGHERGPAAKNERRPAQDSNEWPGHRVTVDRLAKNQTLPSSIIFRIVRTFLPPSGRPVRPAPDSSFAYATASKPVEGKLIYFCFFFIDVRAKGGQKGWLLFSKCFRFKLKCFGGKKRRPDARTSPAVFVPISSQKKGTEPVVSIQRGQPFFGAFQL